jgi:hypothetical protein
VPAATRLSPAAYELGENDSCVVEHQPVAGWQQVRQIADMVMLDRLPPAVYDHQPGVQAMPQRFLGDEPPRHFVIKERLGLGHCQAADAEKIGIISVPYSTDSASSIQARGG